MRGFRAVEIEIVIVLAEHELVFAVHRREGIFELGIDEQHRCPAVLDDVVDLFDLKPEVDRYEHSPEATDPEEAHEQSGRVLRHDGDPLTLGEAQGVEPSGLGSRPGMHLLVGQRTQRRRGLVRLVDEPHAVAVDHRGTLQEVTNGQRYAHGIPSSECGASLVGAPPAHRPYAADTFTCRGSRAWR